MTTLIIQYANPDDKTKTVKLEFLVRSHAVALKWMERVLAAQKYKIDCPDRFYGFNTIEQEQASALAKIKKCIATINSHRLIINRDINTVTDQDTLNYLHHIFEKYHGLLDQQTSVFWKQCPSAIKIALAELNILVHRCESSVRGNSPRHVVTWYGLPKDHILEEADYTLFSPKVEFGTVYLNYVEIGKTLDDLANDNDQYISDSAFIPYTHYSADFNVRFWNTTENDDHEYKNKVSNYFNSHIDFFNKKGYTINHPKLSPGILPVADLVTPEELVIEMLAEHQFVKSVQFI